MDLMHVCRMGRIRFKAAKIAGGGVDEWRVVKKGEMVKIACKAERDAVGGMKEWAPRRNKDGRGERRTVRNFRLRKTTRGVSLPVYGVDVLFRIGN